MKRSFFTRMLRFLLLQLGVLATVLAISRIASNGRYFEAARDKHRLLSTATAPRVLVAGGSSSAFGIQSGLLGALLKRTPVNVALHAGLGRDYILGELDHAIREKDIAILSLEYELYGKPRLGPDLWEIVLVRPAAFADFHYLDGRFLLDRGLGLVHHIARGAVVNLRVSLAPSNDSVYRRTAFNAFGDVTAHAGRPPVRPLSGIDNTIAPSPENLARTIEQLTRLINSARAKDATVLLFFPPLARTVFEANRESIQAIVRQTRAALGAYVLGTIDDVPWADDDFYDTVYHLKTGSARSRTQMMALRVRHRPPVSERLSTLPSR